MLSQVVIKNFKSIGEPGINLELKPLTILVGPNGGGKSSILEAILLGWKGGELCRPEGGMRLPWINEDVGLEQIIHRGDKGQTLSIQLIFGENFTEDLIPCVLLASDPSGFTDHYGVVSLADGSFQESPSGILAESWSKFKDNLRRNFDEGKGKVFFVSAARGTVPTQREAMAQPSSAGIRGEYLLPYLAMLFGINTYNKEARLIAQWAGKFGMGELKAGPRFPSSGGTRFGADYVDAPTDAFVQLAHASTGSRQVLTVITEIFAAPPGSLIMIEEPEISLHPVGQSLLPEMFAEAIKQEKQIVITTHSHYLLLALKSVIWPNGRNAKAKDEKCLKPEDVAVWEITKGVKGTAGKRLAVTPEGYIKGWVSSFAKVDRQLLKDRVPVQS